MLLHSKKKIANFFQLILKDLYLSFFVIYNQISF